VGRYQKGKTNLDFTGARDSGWQWQTDNHASILTTQFFTGRMPFLPPNQQRQSTEGNNCFMAGDSKCDGLQAGVKMTALMRNTVLNKNSYSSMRNVVYFFCRNTIKK